MLRGSQIGRIQAFIDTWSAVFTTLNGRQMMTFGVWRWNEAKGGMRFAFPPYGLRATGDRLMGGFIGYLTNCFITGEEITKHEDGSWKRDRINLSFAGFDIILLQRGDYLGGSLSQYRGQTIITTEVHVPALTPHRFDELLEKLKGLADLLSFAIVSEVSLCGWDYPDHEPHAQRLTVIARAGGSRPVIETMDGAALREFLQESWTKYFSERDERKLPVAIAYFVIAETHALPFQLKLASMFILFENLKATYAVASRYPYINGFYCKTDGIRWSFKALLEEMFGVVGMSPDLANIVALRNEIIHSGISQLPFSQQAEIYSQLRDISREYFVRLLGYRGPYFNYSDRCLNPVQVC